LPPGGFDERYPSIYPACGSGLLFVKSDDEAVLYLYEAVSISGAYVGQCQRERVTSLRVELFHFPEGDREKGVSIQYEEAGSLKV